MNDFFNSFLGKLVVNVVSFLVIWTLMDMAWAQLISHSAFQYSIREHIIDPIGVAVIYTLIDYFVLKKKSK